MRQPCPDEDKSLTFGGGNAIQKDMKDNGKKTIAETIADDMRAEDGNF